MDFYNIIQSELKVYINTIIMRALFEGDKYGYEICKEIETRTSGQYKIKQPTLYSTLKRLEAQGFIKSYEDESVTHGGKRRYYSLTDMGLETFTKSQNDWEYSRTVMDRLISDKDVDLSAYPPVELPKRISRPKAKKAADEQPEKATPDYNGASETAHDSAAASEPLKDETDYSLLARPVQKDAYAEYAGGASYASELQNQIFIEDAATLMNINDAEFSLIYRENPYDSKETAPYEPEYEKPQTIFSSINDQQAGTAAVNDFPPAPIAEKESDAVFLPPPEPEPEPARHTLRRSALFERSASSQSDDDQKQSYIDVEYKNILSRYVRFNVESSGELPASAAALKFSSEPAAQPQVKIINRSADDDGLDDIRVRQHNKNANIRYTQQNYVYVNKLGLMKSVILSAIMLLEVLAYYLIFDVFMGRVVAAERFYFFIAGVVAILPLIYSLTAYAIDPDKKKRAHSYIENLLIFLFAALVSALAVFLICGWAFGMTRNNMEEFYVRFGLFALLSTGFIINSVIFSIIHRSRRYAV